MNSSLFQSLGVHALLIAVCLAIALWEQQPDVEKEVSFTVVETFKVVETKKEIPPPPPPQELSEPKKAAPEPKRQVYGVSRKSLTSDVGGGVEVKAGNTLAKAQDDLVLEPGDEDSIPIPTDEFQVTAMPRVLEEVRPTYPESARKQGIEGTVLLEIIIDQMGLVRQVTVLKSLGNELDQAAIEAIKKFKFRPAQVNDRSVAVKINYGIKFVLEI